MKRIKGPRIPKVTPVFLLAGFLAMGISALAAAEPQAAAVPDAVDGAATGEAELPEYKPGQPLDGDLLGEPIEYYTWSQDTLLDVARADQLGLPELMAANPGVDRWLPGKAERLILPTQFILPDAPRKGIVINLAELRLYYFAKEGWVESYPIGVGRGAFATPVGRTKVVAKKADPVWKPTAGARRDDPELPAVVPAGPDNPLGEYALYLGWPTYLIHGTSKPWGVGRRVSRGCIRLYPEDIAWLFENVPVGTPVTVVNQPIKLGRKQGELYIEVHPSLTQVDELEETGVAKPDPLPDQTDRILTAAGDDIPRLDWSAIDRALSERTGLPTRITRRDSVGSVDPPR
jgi:L,D-transpeptidase ErfK/SrfK